MLLNSVVIVLLETLEAALLITVLLVISRQLWNRNAWAWIGAIMGGVLSFSYASHMGEVSEWLDYVGQEVVNASLHTLTASMVVLSVWALAWRRRGSNDNGSQAASGSSGLMLFVTTAAAAVALTITREGAETWLYLGGFFQQEAYFHTILAGSSIGFGIGLSIGILLYYGLLGLPGRWRLWAPVILMALFTGNMLSQAVMQLTQADWISSGQAFWDTSVWLPESSVAGQSLYALIGYEATPSAMQVVAYFAGVVLVLISVVIASRGGQGMRARGGQVAVIFLSLMLCWPASGRADSFVIDKIYHPYVQSLEQELEWRTTYQDHQPAVADDSVLYQLAYGRALSDRWFVEAYLVGLKSAEQNLAIQAYELEAIWQISEQGEYWADWGLLFEMEREANEDIWEFGTAALVEKEWGKWSATANFYVLNKWGQDIEDSVETKLNLQARYRYSMGFEPAVEFYNGPNTRGLGPVFLGQVKLPDRRRLSWEIGTIFGLDNDSPNQTYRLLLEFEF